MVTRLPLRRKRAEAAAHAAYRAVERFLFIDRHEHRPDAREVINARIETYTASGIEVLTDFDREQIGLPQRGPDGWTVDEIIALEKMRLDAMNYTPRAIVLSSGKESK